MNSFRTSHNVNMIAGFSTVCLLSDKPNKKMGPAIISNHLGSTVHYVRTGIKPLVLPPQLKTLAHEKSQ